MRSYLSLKVRRLEGVRSFFESGKFFPRFGMLVAYQHIVMYSHRPHESRGAVGCDRVSLEGLLDQRTQRCGPGIIDTQESWTGPLNGTKREALRIAFRKI
jgi:hypothetical protein